MPPLVTVLGDALLDVHVIPDDVLRPGQDASARVRLEPGGQGANLAVRLARRGVETRLACALGVDAAGRVVRDALEESGVDLAPAVEVEATGVVVVLVDGAGARTMLSQRVPLADRLDVAAAAGGADWLVVSGYLLLEPGARNLAIQPEMRRAVIGCTLEASGAEAWTRTVEWLRPDLLVLNRDEAAAICGDDRETDGLAVALADRLGALVVVTEPTGASAAIGGVVRSSAATSDSPATDSTGAGDAFAAPLIARLAGSDWPPTSEALGQALQDAVTLGSAVARVAGAQGRVAGEGP